MSPKSRSFQDVNIALGLDLTGQSQLAIVVIVVVGRKTQSHLFNGISVPRFDVSLDNFDGTRTARTQSATIDEIGPSIVRTDHIASQGSRSKGFSMIQIKGELPVALVVAFGFRGQPRDCIFLGIASCFV